MQDNNKLVLQNGGVAIPTDLAPFMAKGTLKKAGAYLLEESKLPAVKGEKMPALKERIGKDKAKALLATYNAGKVRFGVWSAQVDSLSAGDASMSKAVKVRFNAKGDCIGLDTRKRFVAQSSEAQVLAAENTMLKARLAAIEAAQIAAQSAA